MNARARLVLVSTLIITGVLILIGTTYQGVATALERRRYPHPGQLVDVGGHQLHIYCLGEGTPIVVLEAPAASMSAVWGWVQPEVAKTTRVCSYDRAGLGWSEAGDRPYDPGRVPEELHALLAAAKLPPPYVLAGHSLGASFVRRFASLYPTETAATVMIDPVDDVQVDARFAELSPWFARAGVLRLVRVFSTNQTDLPDAQAGPVRAFEQRPDHLTRSARELIRWNDAVRLGQEARVPESVSLTRVQSRDADDLDDRYYVIASGWVDEKSAGRITGTIVDLVNTIRGSRIAGRGSR
jgi:pimeloyl-ACP methyl ester carboxylesterase